MRHQARITLFRGRPLCPTDPLPAANAKIKREGQAHCPTSASPLPALLHGRAIPARRVGRNTPPPVKLIHDAADGFGEDGRRVAPPRIPRRGLASAKGVWRTSGNWFASWKDKPRHAASWRPFPGHAAGPHRSAQQEPRSPQ